MFEIIAADELGYREVWVSEHIGVHRIDTEPAPELFICAAAERTHQIRLGVAVRCLPLYHPIDVATQASACDHLTRGRDNFGFGAGTRGDLQLRQRGFSGEERHPRMLEALDLVLRCWTSSEPRPQLSKTPLGRIRQTGGHRRASATCDRAPLALQLTPARGTGLPRSTRGHGVRPMIVEFSRCTRK